MNKKGLTITMIFEATSANYGEGVGNITALKKISRGDGESYTYISRQAIRYNIINQMGVDNTELDMDKSVIQFAPLAKIDKYAEIDLFGYMKTKDSKTRSAVVRLSNAVSLEPYSGDLDFLTNKSLFDRYKRENPKAKEVKGGNIAQSEIHTSFYSYTITIDLDRVGIDENDNIEIENSEKANRIINFLKTIKFLYRDIKGRREDLKPLFAIGGVYDIKNPFFESKIKVHKNRIEIETLLSILGLGDEIKNNTNVGIISGIFNNEDEIVEKLNAVPMSSFFNKIEGEVNNYYGK